MKKMTINKGIIAINKPQGWTSFDVVNKIKHILKMGKVGHLGTLDPLATGVLLITVGKATKLFDIMQKKQKTYIAKFKFDILTDTLDISGKIVANSSRVPSKNEILNILPKFEGKILQIPPKYSAKSIKGVRAYDLARKNVEFDIPAKEVEIFDIQLENYSKTEITLKIVCGSGTYIRAIGRDIGECLNCYLTMSELTRTKVGNFELKNCQNIENLTAENIENNIIKIKDILNFPICVVGENESKKLLNGQKIASNLNNGKYLLCDENDAIAIVEVEKNIAKMCLYLG